MFTSVHLTFTTLFASMFMIMSFQSASVQGHGHLVESFTGFADFRINQNGVNECGLVSLPAIREALNRSTPIPVKLGAIRAFTYQITNQDGAGELTVAFDESGIGNQFTKRGTVLDQPPGQNGNLPSVPTPELHPVSIFIPANLNCRGPKNTCIMQVRQAQGFGSCVFITPEVNPPPPPPPRPSPTPSPVPSPALAQPQAQIQPEAQAQAPAAPQAAAAAPATPATPTQAAAGASPGMIGNGFGFQINGQPAFGQAQNGNTAQQVFSRFFRGL